MASLKSFSESARVWRLVIDEPDSHTWRACPFSARTYPLPRCGDIISVPQIMPILGMWSDHQEKKHDWPSAFSTIQAQAGRPYCKFRS
jgi:hypothetical protein